MQTGPRNEPSLPDPSFPPRLVAGYRDFLDGRYAQERAHYAAVAEAQSPEVMVIACCDSHVSPTVIFDALPGELFMVRNVANLVPPYEPGGHHATSAALEFAVKGLEVAHIVVLGHARCGGVLAFGRKRSEPATGDFIGQWMSLLEPAAQAAGIAPSPDLAAEALTALEYAAVGHSLNNLRTFPWIVERERAGRIALHGAYFSVATGTLEIRDPASGRFSAVGRRNPFRAERVEAAD